MIDIRHFRYFQAVAQELHFGRAAARLCIVQPALSRQIQQLEGEIGTPLLRRTQRRVELLPAGQLFLERSNLILEEVERAAIDARRVVNSANRVCASRPSFASSGGKASKS